MRIPGNVRSDDHLRDHTMERSDAGGNDEHRLPPAPPSGDPIYAGTAGVAVTWDAWGWRARAWTAER
jgi:hypothetical protein